MTLVPSMSSHAFYTITVLFTRTGAAAVVLAVGDGKAQFFGKFLFQPGGKNTISLVVSCQRRLFFLFPSIFMM